MTGRDHSGRLSGMTADSGDAANGVTADDASTQGDWAWVEEWRRGREPVPWSSGLPLAVFAALLAGVAVYVLAQSLADRPLLAVAINVLAAAGIAPACWLARTIPVLRWLAAGVVLGVLVGWLSALVVIPIRVG